MSNKVTRLSCAGLWQIESMPGMFALVLSCGKTQCDRAEEDTMQEEGQRTQCVACNGLPMSMLDKILDNLTPLFILH